jgi:aspartyl-tRNA(Asn)/glutamyl-tRNA(Gln) amidotransferase subunit C
MSIRAEDVRKVAALAELEVREADLDTLTRELDRIVGYVGQLDALGATPASAPFHPGPERAALRADEVRPLPLARPPAEFAPDFREGFFSVPRLASLDEG